MKLRTIERSVDKAYNAAREMSENRNAAHVTYEKVVQNNQSTTARLLRDAPDYAKLVNFQSVIPAPLPNEIITKSPEDLLRVVTCFNEKYCEGRISPAAIEKSVAHEADHANVARHLGFQAIHFSLSIGCVVEGESVDWYASHEAYLPERVITKIELASMIAYPLKPSEGDEADLCNMGYDGSRDVAERIAVYNEHGISPRLLAPRFCDLDADPSLVTVY